MNRVWGLVIYQVSNGLAISLSTVIAYHLSIPHIVQSTPMELHHTPGYSIEQALHSQIQPAALAGAWGHMARRWGPPPPPSRRAPTGPCPACCGRWKTSARPAGCPSVQRECGECRVRGGEGGGELSVRNSSNTSQKVPGSHI